MSDYNKNRSEKMDRQGSRTPADTERKYSFGKSFAEANGLALDARRSAEEAKKAADEAKEAANIDHDEVFNLLTKNGTVQGIYEKDGQIYINAAYIQSLEKMFAKDLIMTGKFINTAEVYVAPGEAEINAIRQHILGNVTISGTLFPLYDFDCDGELTVIDMLYARRASIGSISVSELPNFSIIPKSTVTLTIDLSNPEKAICISGANAWGRAFESYVGVNFTSIKNPDTEQRIDDLREKLSVDYILERKKQDITGTNGTYIGEWIWEKWNSGIVKLYARANLSVAITQKWGSVYRSGAKSFTFPFPIYSPLCVLNNAFGVEEAIWSGQAQLPIYNSENNEAREVRCEAFCGNSNTVNTAFYIEVVGYWDEEKRLSL